MPIEASPSPVDFQGDALLGTLLDALEPYAALPLLFDYAGRTIQPGYHLTEVKAGAFVTLDCGGNPDRWQETILQIEDLPASDGDGCMLVGKFRSILDRVAARIALAADARLTFEVGRPDEPMQIFDLAALAPQQGHVLLRLMARSAICKPRHRAARQVTSPACCAPASSQAGCC